MCVMPGYAACVDKFIHDVAVLLLYVISFPFFLHNPFTHETDHLVVFLHLRLSFSLC